MKSDDKVYNELLAINHTLLAAGKENANRFLYAFLDREDSIVECLKRVNGVKSEVYLKNVDQELGEVLRFSSIFSDLTLLNMASSPTKPTDFTYFDPQSEYWRDRQLTIPAAYVPEMGPNPGRFFSCYMNRQDDEIKTLLEEYGPFIKEGRLLIRPLRGMYVNFPERKEGVMYYVDPNTPNDHWFINEQTDRDFISINNGLISPEIVNLFKLTLPFFADIRVDNLNNILADESDTVAAFRAQLKKLINEAGDHLDNLSEIREDLIRPAIDSLERKFNAAKGVHRLTVGATLGSFTLTLAIASIQANLLDILRGFGSAAVGTILLSERYYQDKMDLMKDNPYYLLWRIQRNG
jgi:hypothetical protein